MHDRPIHHDMNDHHALAAALQSIPATRPDQDTWPALATRIRRRRRTRQTVWFTLPAAFAACLALALLWPRGTGFAPKEVPQAAQQAGNAATVADAAEFARLQASSRQWQAWVRTLDADGAPLDGRALVQAVALQDRIGMIDLQLSAAREPATLARLWQDRIVLLQRLGLLHLQSYAVADQTRPAAVHAIPM